MDIKDAFPAVFSRLKKVQKAGQEAGSYKASCPAHDDHNPSLVLWPGRDGRLMLRCWSKQCPVPNVLAALGLTWADLFPGKGTAAREDRKVVACYDYQDRDGTVLYTTVRFVPKDFRQRRPVPGTKDVVWSLKGGGYVKDGNAYRAARPTDAPGRVVILPELRYVPFRLPALLGELADNERTLFWCEGEKDALTLVKVGLVATCGVGGSSLGWREEYERYVVGRTVIVPSHNDAVGRKYARDVVGGAMDAGAKAVGILHPPGVGPAGDVSDWVFANRELGRAGVVRRLQELILEAGRFVRRGRSGRD